MGKIWTPLTRFSDITAAYSLALEYIRGKVTSLMGTLQIIGT